MTIVEFYDADPIENAVSILLDGAEKIIYIGYNRKQLNRVIEDYKEIALSKNIKVQFEYEVIDRNDLSGITTLLENIVKAEGNCVFDLSGGDDLYLVAAGIVYEKNKDKVQLHRFNVRNGKLTDCDADGNVLQTRFRELSLNQIIKCSSGRIVYDTEEPKTTHIWDFTDELKSDVEVLWELCSENNRYWNMMLSAIGQNTISKDNEQLTREINYISLKRALNQKGVSDHYIKEFFEKLLGCGFIKTIEITERTLSYKYKNRDVKDLLTKAGLLLELFITINAIDFNNKDGTSYYNDVLTGVVINWDDEEGKRSVRNEIDVLLVKGLVPVFISCKNGEVEVEELYKLSAVANRFGGKCAKKVIVAPSIEEMGNEAIGIIERANEMGIRIIKKLDGLSESQFNDVIKNLWC